MVLTPLDAEKTRFRSGFRGYVRDEVEHFRADLIAALEEHIAVESQLKARIAALESQLNRYRETENLVKDSVVLAQRTCDELIAAAHQKADVIRQEAQQEGAHIRRELAELRSQREQFEYAFHGLLAGFKHRLEQGNPALVASADSGRELAGGTSEPARAATPAANAAPAETEPPVAEPSTDLFDAMPVTPQPEPAPQADPVAATPRFEPVQVPVPAPRPATVPGVPAPQPITPRRHTPATEVDRDADIHDFTAAIDDARPDPQPVWPEAPATGETAVISSEQPDTDEE